MQEPYIKPDLAKLQDVVHYIVSRCSPEQLGDVTLHKVLYFADMLHFVDKGVPLTGVDYLKQQFGPTARNLSWAIEKMVENGRIRVDRRLFYGFEKKDYIAIEKPEPNRLGNDEQALLNDVIEFVVGRTAKEISELSHDVAWQAASMGERIPYAAAFGLQAGEISPEEIDEYIEEARRLRPLIEAETHGSPVF